MQRALFDPNRLAPELGEEEETPLEDFPQYKISREFPIAPAGWALAVKGLVARPLTLSIAELAAAPADAHARAAPLRRGLVCGRVLGRRAARRSSPGSPASDPRARYVEFRSFDSGYWSSWDLESALHPQTILAYGMNGAPLRVEHGAPLRLYSAVKLGYKMVKYLTEVSFLPVRTGGYWEDQGYEWFAGV